MCNQDINECAGSKMQLCQSILEFKIPFQEESTPNYFCKRGLLAQSSLSKKIYFLKNNNLSLSYFTVLLINTVVSDIFIKASSHLGPNPPCSKDPLVTCVNTPGGFTCGMCPPGYSGKGYYCTDIDECSVNNGGCSLSPRVQCTNTRGSRHCGSCPAGYSGNGITCMYLGACHINNGGCSLMATCIESAGIVRLVL